MKKSYIVIILVILIVISSINVLFGFFTGGGNEEVAIDPDQFDHIEIDTDNADIHLQIANGKPYVELVNKEKYKLNVKVKGNTLGYRSRRTMV